MHVQMVLKLLIHFVFVLFWSHDTIWGPLFEYWIILCSITELVINHCCIFSQPFI